MRTCLGPRFEGWRFGAFQFALSATVVFLINLIATIWSFTKGSNNGQLYGVDSDDCSKSKQINIALHVLINILSTILLAGSNYCMQCLSAPTRDDIDKAHKRGIWLDIGVPGVRNLRYIGRKRSFLWVLLGASSLPLHLLYNSVVFGTLSSNSYNVFSVSDAFLEDSECRNCTGECPLYQRPCGSPEILQELWRDARKATKLANLTAEDCIREYATGTQSRYRNVLLVSANKNFPGPDYNRHLNNSHVYWSKSIETYNAWNTEEYQPDVYDWVCSGLKSDDYDPYGYGSVGPLCSVQFGSISPQEWHVGSDGDKWPVDYCLSEKTGHCKVRFEPTIGVIVTIVNLFKVAIMLYVALSIDDEPIATMGDAVESFLNRHDAYTSKKCLATKQSFVKGLYEIELSQWSPSQTRWKDMISRSRRIWSILLFTVGLVIIVTLLVVGITQLPSGVSLRHLRFGAIDPKTEIQVPWLTNSLYRAVLVANTPQLFLSLVYFNYNALFTYMLLGYEWVSFSKKRKGLRVSHQPKGEQRSTYFLQLPYRFSLPLISLSASLHWLISQSIFLISIEFYDEFDNYIDMSVGDSTSFWYDVRGAKDVKTLGYSPVAIIAVLVVGVLMIIVVVGVAYIPYHQTMPLAGSSSMAIGAACHTLEEDEPARKRLMWGVVDARVDRFQHCSFSSKPVTSPVSREVYL